MTCGVPPITAPWKGIAKRTHSSILNDSSDYHHFRIMHPRQGQDQYNREGRIDDAQLGLAGSGLGSAR